MPVGELDHALAGDEPLPPREKFEHGLEGDFLDAGGVRREPERDLRAGDAGGADGAAFIRSELGQSFWVTALATLPGTAPSSAGGETASAQRSSLCVMKRRSTRWSIAVARNSGLPLVVR